MNILLVAEFSIAQVIGGSERVLRSQALGLAARGHAVRVLTRARTQDRELRVVVEGVEETRYPVDRRTALSFVLSSVRNAGRAVAAMARESRPDVLLVHQALPGLAVLGAFLRVPYVYLCHSLAHEEFETRYSPPSGPAARLWYWCQSMARRQIEGAVLKRASRVVVLSDFMRRRMVACYRVPDACVRVIPGGVDVERFCPVSDRRPVRAALGLEETGFVILTVRNLVPRMGLDTLLRAMARVRQAIPHAQLLIGGSGPLRSELESLAKTLNLEGCVRFLGFVPEEALPEYYRAADVFVLPTAQLEGFGLVTIEALACGTPVLGTPVGATDEILGQLDRAFITAGSDADSLADGIASLYRRLAADPAVRERLSAECRALALRDYTWARHCAQVEAVLSEALCAVPAGGR